MLQHVSDHKGSIIRELYTLSASLDGAVHTCTTANMLP